MTRLLHIPLNSFAHAVSDEVSPSVRWVPCHASQPPGIVPTAKPSDGDAVHSTCWRTAVRVSEWSELAVGSSGWHSRMLKNSFLADYERRSADGCSSRWPQHTRHVSASHSSCMASASAASIRGICPYFGDARPLLAGVVACPYFWNTRFGERCHLAHGQHELRQNQNQQVRRRLCRLHRARSKNAIFCPA